jgi:hypothetical protein
MMMSHVIDRMNRKIVVEQLPRQVSAPSQLSF